MTRASPKFVAVSDNCLDVHLSKDVLTAGGNALNVAAQWRRNGSNAPYSGAVGSDPEGETVGDGIAHAGHKSTDIERRAGASGAWFDDGSAIWHGEATPVDVVDTCGAGDSFIAAFPTGSHYEGLGARDALDKASAASAPTCLHLGGFLQEPRPIPASLLAKYAGYPAQRNTA